VRHTICAEIGLSERAARQYAGYSPQQLGQQKLFEPRSPTRRQIAANIAIGEQETGNLPAITPIEDAQSAGVVVTTENYGRGSMLSEPTNDTSTFAPLVEQSRRLTRANSRFATTEFDGINVRGRPLSPVRIANAVCKKTPQFDRG